MSPIIIMLLASVGPMLVGFDLIDDDDDEEDLPPEIEEVDDDDEEELPPEMEEVDETGGPGSPDDPVTTMSISDFIDDARSSLGDTGPFNVIRGTDAVQDFVGLVDVSNIFDTSGGNDSIVGGMLDDTLIGGEDSDQIEGGDGDDALFGGFNRATRDDDFDADVLDGGAGDDMLFLGEGDTATGGAGADIFVTVQDARDNSTITDFNVAEDSLVVEAVNPDELSVASQAVTESGLVVTLSNGATITLTGLLEEIAPEAVLFMDVDPLLSNVWT